MVMHFTQATTGWGYDDSHIQALGSSEQLSRAYLHHDGAVPIPQTQSQTLADATSNTQTMAQRPTCAMANTALPRKSAQEILFHLYNENYRQMRTIVESCSQQADM